MDLRHSYRFKGEFARLYGPYRRGRATRLVPWQLMLTECWPGSEGARLGAQSDRARRSHGLQDEVSGPGWEFLYDQRLLMSLRPQASRGGQP